MWKWRNYLLIKLMHAKLVGFLIRYFFCIDFHTASALWSRHAIWLFSPDPISSIFFLLLSFILIFDQFQYAKPIGVLHQTIHQTRIYYAHTHSAVKIKAPTIPFYLYVNTYKRARVCMCVCASGLQRMKNETDFRTVKMETHNAADGIAVTQIRGMGWRERTTHQKSKNRICNTHTHTTMTNNKIENVNETAPFQCTRI